MLRKKNPIGWQILLSVLVHKKVMLQNWKNKEVKLDRGLGNSNTIMARLSKREWENKALTEYTKIKPVFSVPYSRGVNAGATIKRQKCWLNTFHMRCLKSILNISWQDHILCSCILLCAKILSVYSLLH